MLPTSGDRKEIDDGKILVVDDDAERPAPLQYTLKQAGYEVVVAGDGAEALPAVGGRGSRT